MAKQKITDDQSEAIWQAMKLRAEPGTLDSLEAWLADYGLEKGQEATDKAMGSALMRALRNGSITPANIGKDFPSLKANQRDALSILQSAVTGWPASKSVRVVKSVDDLRIVRDPFNIEQIEQMVDRAIARHDFTQEGERTMSQKSTPSPHDLLIKARGHQNGGATSHVPAVSGYDSRSNAFCKHARTGEIVIHKEQPVPVPSRQELAKIGVLYKFAAKRSRLPNVHFSDHESEILDEMLTHDSWVGDFAGKHYDQESPMPGAMARKALLEDSTSNGIQLNPVWFDERIVVSPLLTGELLPNVDLTEMPRGSQVQGARMLVPTVAWAGADSSVSLFSTAGITQNLNVNVNDVACAITVGNDLLSDSPAAIGQTLQTAIGMRMAHDLDRVIAVGTMTGTSTEPTGIFATSGITSVIPTFPVTGPLMIQDAECLAFAVNKAYRAATYGPCYVASDTTYRRFRSVPVGTDDSRRVFGMDPESYELFNWPFRVNNDIPDGYAGFVALRMYRLYKRASQEIFWTREGQTLGLANQSLLIVRGRYGGALADPTAAAVMLNASMTG